MKILRNIKLNLHSLVLGLIIIFSSGLRIFLVYRQHFPLNDGGMFYSIVNQILVTNFSFPKYLTYNNINIPFAYPPLSFYLMAFLEKITRIPLILLFQYVPMILSVLLIPCFYYFSLNITKKNDIAIISTLFFTLLPSSFIWFIMGGGLTRVFGCLFAILTVLFFFWYQENKNGLILILTGGVLGLTFLSHVIWSLFAVYVLITIILFSKSILKDKLISLIILAVTSFITALPWLILVIKNHSIMPLLSGFLSGQQGLLLDNILFYKNFAWEGLLPLITVVSLLGLYSLVLQNEKLLPVLFAIIFILSGRGLVFILPFIYPILSAYFVVDFLSPNFASISKKLGYRYTSSARVQVFFITCLISIHSILGIFSFIKTNHPAMQTVSESNLKAYEWVKSNSHKNENYLIITDSDSWGYDYISEWFPAYTNKNSVLTVQGTEWTPKFRNYITRYDAFKKCSSFDCVYKIIPETDIGYLYFNNHNSPLYFDAKYKKKYKEVYSNKEVTIYALLK